MPLLHYGKDASPFSCMAGFIAGLISMIYLFLRNKGLNEELLTYITFSCTVFIVSIIFGTGVFFITQFLIKELNWNNSKT